MTALVDSGSFLTLVRGELVPTGVVDYSRQEDILCVHRDSHSYPTAEVTVVVDEQPYLLTGGDGKSYPLLLSWVGTYLCYWTCCWTAVCLRGARRDPGSLAASGGLKRG